MEEKMLLEILQNSQENTCARVSFSMMWQVLWDFDTGIFLRPLQNFQEQLFAEHLWAKTLYRVSLEVLRIEINTFLKTRLVAGALLF